MDDSNPKKWNSKCSKYLTINSWWRDYISGWWFGTWICFSIYWEQWSQLTKSFFLEGWLNHQPDIYTHIDPCIYANIGGILMVNVTIYSIHGSDGIYIYTVVLFLGVTHETPTDPGGSYHCSLFAGAWRSVQHDGATRAPRVTCLPTWQGSGEKYGSRLSNSGILRSSP